MSLNNFYSNCDPNNPEAQQHRELRRVEYHSWRSSYHRYLADADAERDWDEYGARISATTGVSASLASARLMTFSVLEKLPQLQAHAEKMMHLSMYLLGAIAEQMFSIHPGIVNNPETWRFLDTHLTAYLTPRKPQQKLPTRKAIVEKIRRLLAELQEHLLPQQTGEEDALPSGRTGYYEQHPGMDGTVDTVFNLEKGKAEVIDKAVRSYAKKNDCTRSEALAELILANTSVSVSLNVYQAHDVEDAPLYLADGSIISDGDWLLSMMRHTRDMDATALLCLERYGPSKSLCAYLEGRDGTCRFPGCDRPAELSDKDHCVNYEDGGKTSAANMISLCRHHHNVKTDKSIRYFFDPVTADVYWLFQDGTWVVDEATGPLAPSEKRWLRTLQQRWEGRYRREWEE